MVSFNAIPTLIRTPGVYIEFDSSRANQGAALQTYRGLLIGQRRSVGTQAALTPARITSAKQAETYFGAGSMLSEMARAWFASNAFTELWAVAANEPTGTAATGTVTFVVSSPTAGLVKLYIGGRLVSVATSTSSTQNGLAAALAAAIQADATLPVGAGATSNVVTLTDKHTGVVGNDVDLRLNYAEGDRTPSGVAVSIGNMSGGTGDIDLATVWPVLKDTPFNVIVCPIRDTVGLLALETECADRWGPLRAIDGLAISATPANLAGQLTLGAARNSPHVSIMSAYKLPTVAHAVAADYGANVAYYGSIDPARPFQSLTLKGTLPPAASDAFTQQERNQLLFDGIATHVSDIGGSVRIERAITTYKVNSTGADDPSYLDVTTMLSLSYLRFSTRARLSERYPRHKVANDGTRPLEGQAVVTPSVVRAEMLALARQWEELGLVENLDQFAEQIVVTRNTQDPTRLDIVLPPDLINPLIVMAAQIQFRL